jgi:hypothetical protein
MHVAQSARQGVTPMIAVRNTGLWFFSLLFSVGLFSLIYARRYGLESFVFVFRITMIFALPVACLYLPVVIALRDAEEGRMRIIAGVGVLIGPASLALWGLILVARGKPSVWEGDGIGFGIVTCLILASIVGFLTTMFYVIALKLIHRLTTSST